VNKLSPVNFFSLKSGVFNFELNIFQFSRPAGAEWGMLRYIFYSKFALLNDAQPYFGYNSLVNNLKDHPFQM